MTTQTACLTTTAWPRERVLFLLAGTATLISAALAAAVSPWFLLMTTAIGVNQLLLVATGRCPASLVVDRLLARPRHRRWASLQRADRPGRTTD